MRRRVVAVAVALVALQGAALWIYLRAERAAVPEVALERPDGASSMLSAHRGKWVLVHFWATWCPPCREELPGLLALGERLRSTGRFELVAISVDRDWDAVRTFFGGVVPRAVVRARDPDPHRRFGATTLPASYLLDPDGGLSEQFPGARDWETTEIENRLRRSLR